MGHCTEAFTRIALAHEQIHFTLRQGERLVHELPANSAWRERIAAFFGNELAGHLMWVESVADGVTVAGYVAHPDQSRANSRMQYVLLNGRHIRDRSLQHALTEAYRGLLVTGRYPIAFLRIEMPPELVDVNVHPTKLEVRFKDSGKIYSQLLGTLRSRFLATDLTAGVRPEEPFGGGGEAVSRGQSAVAHDAGQTNQIRQELIRWAQGQVGDRPPEPAGSGTSAARPRADVGPGWSVDRPPAAGAGQQRPGPTGDAAAADSMPLGPPVGEEASVAVPADTAGSSALQVHNRYLVAEDERGLVVIDQHALHERILYEDLREKVLSGHLESQRLLVPEPVRLKPAEAAAALDSKDLLAELGIAIESFGGDTVLLSSYPAMLANMSPQEVLRQVVDHLMGAGKLPDRRDLLDELLHMIACKAAIKAGDRLAPGEIAALLEMRHLVQDSHHCPHGRPTALVVTREELDRRFKRI
jgi:DNA mismatch repair protein MutL